MQAAQGAHLVQLPGQGWSPAASAARCCGRVQASQLQAGPRLWSSLPVLVCTQASRVRRQTDLLCSKAHTCWQACSTDLWANECSGSNLGQGTNVQCMQHLWRLASQGTKHLLPTSKLGSPVRAARSGVLGGRSRLAWCA